MHTLVVWLRTKNFVCLIVLTYSRDNNYFDDVLFKHQNANENSCNSFFLNSTSAYEWSCFSLNGHKVHGKKMCNILVSFQKAFRNVYDTFNFEPSHELFIAMNESPGWMAIHSKVKVRDEWPLAKNEYSWHFGIKITSLILVCRISLHPSR